MIVYETDQCQRQKCRQCLTSAAAPSLALGCWLQLRQFPQKELFACDLLAIFGADQIWLPRQRRLGGDQSDEIAGSLNLFLLQPPFVPHVVRSGLAVVFSAVANEGSILEALNECDQGLDLFRL